jgi:hypothetical protein
MSSSPVRSPTCASLVDVLSAAHRVGEVDAPVVAIVDVAHRRRHAALRHHRVGLAEERLADQPHTYSLRRRFDRRPQSRAAGADHDHVVLMLDEFGGHRSFSDAEEGAPTAEAPSLTSSIGL